MRFIAAAQIIGASSSGVIMMTGVLEGRVKLVSIPVLLCMFALIVVAFLSGTSLWNGDRDEIWVSLLIQALQIPVLSTTVLV